MVSLHNLIAVEQPVTVFREVCPYPFRRGGLWAGLSRRCAVPIPMRAPRGLLPCRQGLAPKKPG